MVLSVHVGQGLNLLNSGIQFGAHTVWTHTSSVVFLFYSSCFFVKHFKLFLCDTHYNTDMEGHGRKCVQL